MSGWVRLGFFMSGLGGRRGVRLGLEVRCGWDLLCGERFGLVVLGYAGLGYVRGIRLGHVLFSG